LVVALVGAGTIAAAGAGSYLAVRMNPDVPAEPPAAVSDVQVASPAALPEAGTAATSVAVEPAVTPEPLKTSAPATVAPPIRSGDVTPPKRTARAGEGRTRVEAPRRQTPDPANAVPAADPASVPPPASATVPPVVEPPPTAPPLEASRTQEPPKPRFDEVVVGADSVIGVRLDSAVSSETARIEDKVTARVSRDVSVDGRTAVPVGSRLEGTVTAVELGGKFRERARIGIRFTSLVIGDTRIPIETDTIFREGESPAKESTSKIGASAVVGAILGAVVGGKKGAVIGGTAGAAGGTAAVMAGGRNEVTLAAGTPLAVRLTSPATVLIERNDRN
jgi:hypothetical protein